MHQNEVSVALQKEEDHPEELDKKLAAVCGLYCGSCSRFVATAEDPERLKRLAAQFHFSQQESAFYGCPSDKRVPYCEKCRMSPIIIRDVLHIFIFFLQSVIRW
jgi:hypothetical protein